MDPQGREAAAERLRRLDDLGFDDAILVRGAYTEAGLAAMRALLPWSQQGPS